MVKGSKKKERRYVEPDTSDDNTEMSTVNHQKGHSRLSTFKRRKNDLHLGADDDLSFDDDSSDDEMPTETSSKQSTQPQQLSDEDDDSDEGLSVDSDAHDNSDAHEEDSDALEEDDSDEEQTEEDTTRQLKNLRSEISSLSFAELEQLKKKLGLKVYNEMVLGKKKVTEKKPAAPPTAQKFERKSSSAPLEQSSKRKVKPLGGKRKLEKMVLPRFRDPRFDDLSGKYDERLFKQSYGFIAELQEKEKQELEKQLESADSKEERGKIKSVLRQMRADDLAKQRKEERSARVTNIRKKEKELVSEGKRPYFVKRGEIRQIELAEKYKDLKDSGKLQSYMMRKRKKDASKFRKRIPDRE